MGRPSSTATDGIQSFYIKPFHHYVKETPDLPAAKDKEGTYSYLQLDQRSHHLGRRRRRGPRQPRD